MFETIGDAGSTPATSTIFVSLSQNDRARLSGTNSGLSKDLLSEVIATGYDTECLFFT
ncbi:MAG: hypothetical protein HOI65_01870 [Opitutae bacterium]|nr:hypothetical protein [Opitutae bacterium]